MKKIFLTQATKLPNNGYNNANKIINDNNKNQLSGGVQASKNGKTSTISYEQQYNKFAKTTNYWPESEARNNSNNHCGVEENNIDNNSDSTYEQRKALKKIYGELFSVLFRIPDKQVQQRVLSAINGKEQTPPAAWFCKECKKRGKNIKYVEIATQTESEQSNDPENKSNIDKSHEKSEETTTTTELVNKKPKSRRRKLCVPQVVKKSHAQEVQKDKTRGLPSAPVIKRRKLEMKKATTSKLIDNDQCEKSSNTDQEIVDRNWETVEKWLLSFQTEKRLSEKEVMIKRMTEEYINAEQFTDGLLRIHDAITKNELNILQLQIFVWKEFKKVDLNELITEADEDCLQLAIVNDCYDFIVNTLLNSGLRINTIDEYSNNVLHLGVLNNLNIKSLKILMEKIDLPMLLEYNDDGYTPLQLAVRYNYYQQAEIICDTLDERLFGQRFYKRRPEPNEYDEVDTAEDYENFLTYYERACDNLSATSSSSLKRKFMVSGDMRSGNTALFYAIENDMEHFAYFLLAHLTDPNAQNHCGQSAKAYYNEYSKIFKMNLKVDKIMEKVITLLSEI